MKLEFELEKSYDILIKRIMKSWDVDSYCIINFLYYSNYTLLRKDKEYLNAIENSTYLFPDGIGMQILYKHKYNIKLPNVNGTDFTPELLAFIFSNKIPIAIYGTTTSNLFFFEKWLMENYNKQSYYIKDGFSLLDFKLIKNKSVLLVGRGSPLQEKWVLQNLDIIKEKELLVLTVGGFFDYFSPNNKRAPILFRKLKLEFLYRFLQSPKRNFKKFFRNFNIINDLFE
ncbi:WecB/TagA/CpsF family glycosyltransferase [Joostella sp. CR20]|uniref:WecB/TagA/CpsF family glycosyltransferase n=1 Tax=Joostella sp. CR20 TaxID=2804312 RepID=UPI00313D879B